MEIEYQYEIKTQDGKTIRKSWATDDLNIDKFKEIEKLCFDWGYNIDCLIKFFIENLNKDSTEQLLSTMDGCTICTEESEED